MTKFHKKIRHLSTTMLHWAEDNKKQWNEDGSGDVFQRNGIDWDEDFKFVTKLDRMLSSDIGDKLKKKEMEMCNQLYKYYGNVYDKI
jgi:hypothetical protein